MTTSTFFFVFIPILAILLLGINIIFAPHNPYQEKDSVFECGFHSFLGQNRTQFAISFFIFALLFLLFDLEIILVYPYVVSSYINGVYGLVIILIFLLMLTLGFAFELGKNALKIDSRQTISLKSNYSNANNKRSYSNFNKNNKNNNSYKINNKYISLGKRIKSIFTFDRLFLFFFFILTSILLKCNPTSPLIIPYIKSAFNSITPFLATFFTYSTLTVITVFKYKLGHIKSKCIGQVYIKATKYILFLLVFKVSLGFCLSDGLNGLSFFESLYKIIFIDSFKLPLGNIYFNILEFIFNFNIITHSLKDFLRDGCYLFFEKDKMLLGDYKSKDKLYLFKPTNFKNMEDGINNSPSSPQSSTSSNSVAGSSQSSSSSDLSNRNNNNISSIANHSINHNVLPSNMILPPNTTIPSNITLPSISTIFASLQDESNSLHTPQERERVKRIGLATALERYLENINRELLQSNPNLNADHIDFKNLIAKDVGLDLNRITSDRVANTKTDLEKDLIKYISRYLNTDTSSPTGNKTKLMALINSLKTNHHYNPNYQDNHLYSDRYVSKNLSPKETPKFNLLSYPKTNNLDLHKIISDAQKDIQESINREKRHLEESGLNDKEPLSKKGKNNKL
jgi:NADH-ubiquinone oxidoreductase chain 3